MDSEKRPERTDRKQGGFRRVFKFRYDDIALFLGMSKAACRKAAQRGKFDPGDLESIFAFKAKRVSSDPDAEVHVADVNEARRHADVLSKRLRFALDGVEKLKSALGPGAEDSSVNGHATVHELQATKPAHELDAAV